MVPERICIQSRTKIKMDEGLWRAMRTKEPVVRLRLEGPFFSLDSHIINWINRIKKNRLIWTKKKKCEICLGEKKPTSTIKILIYNVSLIVRIPYQMLAFPMTAGDGVCMGKDSARRKTLRRQHENPTAWNNMPQEQFVITPGDQSWWTLSSAMRWNWK